MPNVQIISDTGHTLPPDIFLKIPMIEIPFEVVVGDSMHKDDRLSLSELAALLESRKRDYPSTSAPPPGDFAKEYRFSMRFDGILVVTLGAKNSASYKNAGLAVTIFREQTGSEIPIEVVDSCGGTMTQGFLIMEADELIKAGESLKEIAATLRAHATGDNLVFALKETTYLYRSGRVKGVQHLVASVLKLKPIVGLGNGELKLIGKARGRRKPHSMVASEVLKRSERRIQKLAIIGGLGTEEGEAMVLEQILSGLESEPEQILKTKICAAMMVHSGPHYVGVAWV